MGMPKFPERDKHPQVCDIVLELIESVAVEELALAHILNAEGEKLQELVKKFSYNEVCPSELDKICSQTYKMINSLVIKEWVLLNKVSTALEVYETMGADHTRCNCKRCQCNEKKCDGPKHEPRNTPEHKI